MLKIFYVLFVFSIIFEGHSIKIMKSEFINGVFFAKLNNYKIKPNNSFIEEKRNGLIQWKNEMKKEKNVLAIYQIIDAKNNEQLKVSPNLCTDIIIEWYPSMLKRFLGIEKCPIERGTISLMSNDKYSQSVKFSKYKCTVPFNITLELRDQKQKKLIMTFDVLINEIRLNRKNCK
ncbi:uncharacterized protein LOC127288690 [Leptopilina boulardi]|uniref:uncharacterized protein LOC127288690 n=1 Tax=Leptopilina boulardi TaxID=63433 RepID=UPI0021F62DE7|nr:uncharacterized protein LOC127288690 [Leptopilina boulardi]